MKYFDLSEFTYSQTAEENRIYNAPDICAVANIKKLVINVLDPARSMLGEPITITSGYRSRELNTKIGGSIVSQHCTGHAADVTCQHLERLYDIIANRLTFDQLIYYKSRNFLHVSYVNHRKNRMQIITKK